MSRGIRAIDQATARYENSPSVEELDRRAQERFDSRPDPKEGANWKSYAILGIGGAATLAAVLIGPEAVSEIRNTIVGSASADAASCVGSQTLVAPEGGIGPIDLVQNNVAGNADPQSIPLNIDVIGRGDMLAGEAGFSIPEGASVQAPVTCVE